MKKLFLYKSFKKRKTVSGKRFPKTFQKSGVPKKFSAHNFLCVGKKSGGKVFFDIVCTINFPKKYFRANLRRFQTLKKQTVSTLVLRKFAHMCHF